MGTLRRATLYMRKDPQAAKELFTKLHARAESPGASGLAYFDAGYLAETFRQSLGVDKGGSKPAAGVDRLTLVGTNLTPPPRRGGEGISAGPPFPRRPGNRNPPN